MKIFEIKTILVTIVLAVVIGVFLHDTKVDKALTAYVTPFALGVAIAVDLSILASRAHTHVEAGDIEITHNANMTRVRRDRRMMRRNMPGTTVLYTPSY